MTFQEDLDGIRYQKRYIGEGSSKQSVTLRMLKSLLRGNIAAVTVHFLRAIRGQGVSKQENGHGMFAATEINRVISETRIKIKAHFMLEF